MSLASLSHLITVVLRSGTPLRCFPVRFRNSLNISNVPYDGSFPYCWSEQLIMTFKRKQKRWTVDCSVTNNKQLCNNNSWPVRHSTDLSQHPSPLSPTPHNTLAINILRFSEDCRIFCDWWIHCNQKIQSVTETVASIWTLNTLCLFSVLSVCVYYLIMFSSDINVHQRISFGKNELLQPVWAIPMV